MCLSYKDVSLSRKFPEGSNTWAHDLHLTPECFKSKSRVIAVKLPRSVLLFIWGLLGIKEGSIWAAAWKFLVDFEPLFPRTFVARHTSGTDPSQSIFRVSSFKSSTISSLLFMQPSPPPPQSLLALFTLMPWFVISSPWPLPGEISFVHSVTYL